MNLLRTTSFKTFPSRSVEATDIPFRACNQKWRFSQSPALYPPQIFVFLKKIVVFDQESLPFDRKPSPVDRKSLSSCRKSTENLCLLWSPENIARLLGRKRFLVEFGAEDKDIVPKDIYLPSNEMIFGRRQGFWSEDKDFGQKTRILIRRQGFWPEDKDFDQKTKIFGRKTMVFGVRQ